MKKFFILLFIIGIGIYSLSFKKETMNHNDQNPFFKEYNTPFEVPPFDRIKIEHFMPAIQEGIKRHNDDIKKIVDNTEQPTFANTIEAYDNSGKFLNDVTTVFFNLVGTNMTDSLQRLQREITPIVTKHQNEISLNPGLFKRIKAVYENKDNLKLEQEQSELLEKVYKRFIRNGAALDAEKQAKLKEINQNLALLGVRFGNNLLSETKKYKLIIENQADLSGLPKSIIFTAAEDAKKAGLDGKWIFTLDNASIMPFLTYADNRELREKILKAYMSRGNNNNEYDTKKIMLEIINLRLEKAKLLGYKNFAQFATEERMSKNPENVYEFLMKLWEPSLKVAKKELADMQEYIQKKGKSFKLEAWDWRYYTEKVRKERFNLDEEQIRPYFSLENVKQGAFMVANKLFGITFSQIKNIPVFHQEATAYEVKDKDGSHLGVLYMDYHPRASKRGGAWCTSFRSQYFENGKEIRPVVSMVCNFSKPTGDTPALLSFDETRTLFHEFGHALHNLLSKIHYRGLRSVVRDYVELPSQIMENWAADPEVIVMYAKHYKTGQVIPKELVEKIDKSSLFNEGFATVEYLAASILDMDFHTITEPIQTIDVMTFEANSMKRIGLISEILPRYKTTYFNHISGDGYSAGYYVYVWAQILDADAFAAFKEKSLFDKRTAQLFRDNVLAKGGSEDELTAYKRFRGTAPTINALLKRKGFE